MGKIIGRGINFSGGTRTVFLTAEDYDLLTQEEKMNGTIYFIDDGEGGVGAILGPFANDIYYDNSIAALLNSDTVQGAIDELLVQFANVKEIVETTYVPSSTAVGLSGSFSRSSITSGTIKEVVTFERAFGQIPNVIVGCSSNKFTCTALEVTQTGFVFEYVCSTTGIENSITFTWNASAPSWSGGMINLIDVLSADSDNIVHSFEQYNTTYPLWKAFDGDSSTAAIAAANTSTLNAYFGYNFAKSVSINEIMFKYARASSNSKNYEFKLQYLKDNIWSDVDGEIYTITASSSVQELKIIFDEALSCEGFRLYFTGGESLLYKTNSHGLKFSEIQAYGKEA